MDTQTSGGAHKPHTSFYMDQGELVARYVFCLGFVKGKDVLDIGCGFGYGTHFLASEARKIIGADTDKNAIEFAMRHYAAPNLQFLISDTTDLLNASFDIVTALEVIEHVQSPSSFLSNIIRLLKPHGQLVLSTPNRLFSEKSYANGISQNPYHLHEFYPTELEQLLGNFFQDVQSYAQIWPNNMDVIMRQQFLKTFKIPKKLRTLVPSQVKNACLKLKGIPPYVDRRGKWQDYPVIRENQIDERYPVQVFQCSL